MAEQVMSLGEINVNLNSDTELVNDTERLVKQQSVTDEWDKYIRSVEIDSPKKLIT